MANEKWEKKCVDCGATVKFGAFGPCPENAGENHKLEPKMYFHPGGQSVQNMQDRRSFGPHIVLVPGTSRVDNKTGNFERIAAVEVHFVRGHYQTADAEEQFHLDRKVGLCDEDTWERIYFTPQQQVDRSNEKLKEIKRQISEGSSLLDQVKAKTQKQATA